MKKIFFVLAIFVGVLTCIPPIAQTAFAQVCKPNSPCYYEGWACALDDGKGGCLEIYVKKDVNNGKFIAVIQDKYIGGGSAFYIFPTQKHDCNYYFTHDNKAWYFRM